MVLTYKFSSDLFLTAYLSQSVGYLIVHRLLVELLKFGLQVIVHQAKTEEAPQRYGV